MTPYRNAWREQCRAEVQDDKLAWLREGLICFGYALAGGLVTLAIERML